MRRHGSPTRLRVLLREPYGDKWELHKGGLHALNRAMGGLEGSPIQRGGDACVARVINKSKCGYTPASAASTSYRAYVGSNPHKGTPGASDCPILESRYGARSMVGEFNPQTQSLSSNSMIGHALSQPPKMSIVDRDVLSPDRHRYPIGKVIKCVEGGLR